MRAARLDLFVETGAEFSTTIVDYEPGPVVAAQDVAPGSHLYVYGVPTVVYDVTTRADRTTIRFLLGLHDDPSFTLYHLDRVMTAVPVPILEAVAAFTHFPPVAEGDPVVETRVDIPVTVAPDGLSVTLAYTADETTDLAPMEGAASWDLYARTASGWTRLREGTLTIIKGDAR